MARPSLLALRAVAALFAGAAAGVEYKVMVANVQNPDGRTRRTSEHCVRDMEHGRLADLMLFQEAGGSDLASDELHGLTGYGYTNGFGGKGMAWKSDKFTKVGGPWNDEIGEDRKSCCCGVCNWNNCNCWTRNLVCVRLAATVGPPLLVCNYHGLLPINTGGLTGHSTAARNVKNAIEAHRESGDLAILGGDFNNVRSHPSGINQRLENDYGFVWHASGPAHGGVDHIYSKYGFATVASTFKNLGTCRSDHEAISVMVTSGGGAPAPSPQPTAFPTGWPTGYPQTSAPQSAPATQPPTDYPTTTSQPDSDRCLEVWGVQCTTGSTTASCGGRIQWLQSSAGGSKSSAEARAMVASECKACCVCGSCAEHTCTKSGSSTPNVWNVDCTLGGGTYSCGERISYVESQGEPSARELIADECAVCEACRPVSGGPQPTAPPTPAPPAATVFPTGWPTAFPVQPQASCDLALDIHCTLDGHTATCGQRIEWLTATGTGNPKQGKSDAEARNMVGAECEMCSACSAVDPAQTVTPVCKLNARCAAEGLTGDNDCCPADNGVFLACCDGAELSAAAARGGERAEKLGWAAACFAAGAVAAGVCGAVALFARRSGARQEPAEPGTPLHPSRADSATGCMTAYADIQEPSATMKSNRSTQSMVGTTRSAGSSPARKASTRGKPKEDAKQTQVDI